VVGAAVANPPVAALLPISITFDALLAALARAGSSSQPGPGVSYAAYGWRDPDDWVAKCEGPILCEKHRHFVCTGAPGNCECHCEVTPPTCVPGIPEDASGVACTPAPPPAPPRDKVAKR
jgi:hypothetical protein